MGGPKEEQSYWKAVAFQITKNGYDSVRACDGSWIKAWAKEFGVSVKGYGLCYHKEWTFQPLGWDFVVETDNKVFNPVVATSDKKQKKSGNRVTNFTKENSSRRVQGVMSRKQRDREQESESQSQG